MRLLEEVERKMVNNEGGRDERRMELEDLSKEEIKGAIKKLKERKSGGNRIAREA